MREMSLAHRIPLLIPAMFLFVAASPAVQLEGRWTVAPANGITQPQMIFRNLYPRDVNISLTVCYTSQAGQSDYGSGAVQVAIYPIPLEIDLAQYSTSFKGKYSEPGLGAATVLMGSCASMYVVVRRNGYIQVEPTEDKTYGGTYTIAFPGLDQ